MDFIVKGPKRWCQDVNVFMFSALAQLMLTLAIKEKMHVSPDANGVNRQHAETLA